MRLKRLMILSVALVLAGCSTTAVQLSQEGQQVRFVDKRPEMGCSYLGSITGEQSNWLLGQQSPARNSLRGAANDLRNRAAKMGGNLVYNAQTPAINRVSSFVPIATKMTGQVYRCQQG